MKTSTRYFVEEYYDNGVYVGFAYEIDSREEYLRKVQKEQGFICFRFYDRKCIEYEGELYTGEPFNYSDFVVLSNGFDYEDLAGKIMCLNPEGEPHNVVCDNLDWLDDYKREVLGESRTLG